MPHMLLLMVIVGTALSSAAGGGNTGPQGARETAPGAEQSAKTSMLETGANLLQSKAPISKLSMYLNGFHVAKGDPKMQMEAHHYCNQVNEDFAQCVLFDGNTDDARMMGIQYIVSENSLRCNARGGKSAMASAQLRNPLRSTPHAGTTGCCREGSAQGEDEQLRKNVAYLDDGHAQRTLQMRCHSGPPHLQWSLNRDGEDAPGMVAARDKRMDMDTARTRHDRADLVSLAKPQGGVDAMGRSPNAKTTAGVIDNGDASTRAVPTFEMK